MNKTILALFEIAFNTSYLIIIWFLVIKMVQSKSENHEAKLFTWAFFSLAFGDTFHVGFRSVAHILGDINSTVYIFGREGLLTGIGAFITAITVTITYLFFNQIWYQRFKNYTHIYIGIILLTICRLILVVMPQNNWLDEATLAWSLLRNTPLLLIGLLLIYVLIKNGLTTSQKFYTNWGIWIMISYGFYLPVILFVRQFPMLGMLMMPKTVAYLVMAILAYTHFFKIKTT